MLSKAAIQEFSERQLKDSGAVKLLQSKKLDELIDSTGAVFVTPPRTAQKVCFLLGWKYDSYLFLLGMGAGKSKLSLDLFRNRKLQGQAKRALVLVPNVVNLTAWEVESSKHAPELTLATLSGDKDSRKAVIDGTCDVVVSTYQGLSQMLSTTVKNKWKMDNDAVDEFAKKFDFLVLDECTAIKNASSLFFQIIRRMSKSIRYRYGLTGTPFDKNPIDLWSQFFVIDEGYTLGETLGLYRQVYFNASPNYWGGIDYSFKKTLKDSLAKRIANRSVRYEESECQDLPPAIGGLGGDLMLCPVVMPPEQRPYYDKLATELRKALGNFTLVDNAYTRMRMVASGWLGATDDETGEKMEITFRSNPKLDAVLDLIQNVPDNEKVIVVHWFGFSGKLIHERLTKEKIPHEWIWGGTPAAQKGVALQNFCDPKHKSKVLLASTAISKGVNLQGASRFMVFFESPDSTIERRQMEARIRREGGIAGTRYYYDVVCKGTIEEKILESLKQGKRLLDVIVDKKGEL
jgi:SNF2 family DNA or RNA helicase